MCSPIRCCHIVSSSMLSKFSQHPDFDAKTRAALMQSAIAAAFARGERVASRFMAMELARTTPNNGKKDRIVYDAAGKSRQPSTPVRKEGDPKSGNAAADAAYDSTGATYDYYMDFLKRNSVDGHGLALKSTVHSGKAPDNAFWDGKQMMFGDATATGPFVGSFAAALDVVAHELTHGVTQYTVPGGGLEYEDESGALNESWSDCMGCVVKQNALKQDVKTADWLIGPTIMNPKYGKALRSMKDPGHAWEQDDQPAVYSKYVQGGDVHTNSGIPNHAFYLAASNLGGNSWDKAGPIWYKALSLLTSRATFAEAKAATIAATKALYSDSEVEAVTAAWKAVGV
jgi:Zn-dependent metalloprotease